VTGSLELSPVDVRCSPQSAEVLSRIVGGIALLVRSPRDAPLTTECRVFDRVWSSGTAAASPAGSSLTFWRPRAPPGYAVLGDCVVAGSSVPTRAVLVVNDAVGILQPPVGFEPVWRVNRGGDIGGAGGLCAVTVWAPVPPAGCVALGHVVSVGDASPSLAAVRCVRREVVSAATLGACVFHRYDPDPEQQQQQRKQQEQRLQFPGGSVWQVTNRLGTFIASRSTARPQAVCVADLRVPLLLNDADAESSGGGGTSATTTSPKTTSGGGGDANSGDDGVGGSAEGSSSGSHVHTTNSTAANLGPRVAITHEFTRVWWETGEAGAGRAASLWRPTCLPGHASLGDVLVAGVEPPPYGAPTVSVRGGTAVTPLGFELVCSAGSGRGREALAVWRPIPPAGYVAAGDCASLSRKDAPPLDACACLRADLAERVDPGALALDDDDGGGAGRADGAPQLPVWADTSKGWRRVRMAMWGLEARDGANGAAWGIFVGHPGAISPHAAYRPARSHRRHGGGGGANSDSDGSESAPLFSIDVAFPRVSVLLLAGSGARMPLAALTVADLVGTVRGREGGTGARDGFSSFTASLDFFNARLGTWWGELNLSTSSCEPTRCKNTHFALRSNM